MLTRHIISLTSSATSSASVLPTGRPSALPSSVIKPGQQINYRLGCRFAAAKRYEDNLVATMRLAIPPTELTTPHPELELRRAVDTL